MPKDQAIRLAFAVTRDFGPENAWGMLVDHLVSHGCTVVASKRPLDRPRTNADTPPLEIFPRDITSGDYKTIAIEQHAHLMMQKFVARSDYPTTHSILMTMLSRRDASGTFRTVDREVLIRRLVLALSSQVLRSSPTHVVFEETPHEVVDFALFEICRFLAIPTLFFQPSLVGPQLVARTAIDRILPVDVAASRRADLESARMGAVEISRAAVQKLQLGDGTALLDRQKRIDAATTGLRSKFRAVAGTARTLLRGQLNRHVNLTGHQSSAEMLSRFFVTLASRSLRDSLRQEILHLRKEAGPEIGRYAIFALHYEPERTNMPEGLPYLSQLDAVLAVRAFLPEGVHLLVKEHYAQQSSALRGYVGRSIYAYDYLDGIPGVQMIGIEANTRELVKGAESVFTMTGKIGIEAAFLGTPVIYLGQPWWVDMPGAYAFSAISSLFEVVERRAPSDQEVWNWFVNQIDRTLLFGLGGTSPARYSDRITPLPKGFELLEFESLANAVGSFLRESP